MEQVRIRKMVHGGQGLAELADGRKVFVWNGLPGELVSIRSIKQKRSYAEAIAEDIIEPSPERIIPKEANYLATSPWQMMTFEAENTYKADIVRELFLHEKVLIPAIIISTQKEKSSHELKNLSAPLRSSPNSATQNENELVVHDDRQWQYRNKMEYSFWGDQDGIHLALHQRGSKGKEIVQGSQLAMPALDAAANAIARQLTGLNARAGDLKTIIVRCNQNGDVVAALYTKLDSFTRLVLPAELKGLRVYHSNPKSPASVRTQLLYELGDCRLTDTLLGKTFVYDVDSFFQVNLPVYEQALKEIKKHVTNDVTDLYAGVGSIGLSVATHKVVLVESDPATAAMARLNLTASGLEGELIETPAEKAIEYLPGDGPVVVDPPRAGLHPKCIEALLTVLPPKIVYMSCNPSTHARDLALLQEQYDISDFKIYNFFPRTPHIETLAVLERKA